MFSITFTFVYHISLVLAEVFCSLSPVDLISCVSGASARLRFIFVITFWLFQLHGMAGILFLCENVCTFGFWMTKAIFSPCSMVFKSDNCNVCRVFATNAAAWTHCLRSHAWQRGSSPCSTSFIGITTHSIFSYYLLPWCPFHGWEQEEDISSFLHFVWGLCYFCACFIHPLSNRASIIWPTTCFLQNLCFNQSRNWKELSHQNIVLV